MAHDLKCMSILISKKQKKTTLTTVNVVIKIRFTVAIISN